MIRYTHFVPLAFASALVAQAPLSPLPMPPRAPVTATPNAAGRPIDLVLCLDISGSMNGLIDAARQNLWAVVNEMATLQPQPDLRVALLTYGCNAHDKEVGWVKVEIELTSDLDSVSDRLFALGTNGGEEYVARVVRAATEQLAWSPDPEALKILFVAGNEAATQDPEIATEVACRAAIGKGIVINSIYCGNPQDNLAPAWRDVAKFADGQFSAIDHNRAVAIETPFDEQLRSLSAAINTTYVPYGEQAGHWAANQVRQDSNAASLNIAAVAQRCQTKGSALYSNEHWDLVDACRNPEFVLADVKKEHLPEELRKLDLAGLQAFVKEQQQKRGEIQKQVAELGAKRDAFVAEKQKQAGEEGLFQNAVIEAVRQQAEARGFERKAPKVEVQPQPESQPAPKSEAEGQVDKRFREVIERTAAEYREFPCVTSTVEVAPTACFLPPLTARISEAKKQHGGKLYLLYARKAENGDYVKEGVPAQVGDTLVKESWQRVEGAATAPTEASKRYGSAPIVHAGEQVSHAGDYFGLFVMHKLDPKTPGTDDGWIYGTIDRAGQVTAAGKIASCIRCHADAPEDRRFGLR